MAAVPVEQAAQHCLRVWLHAAVAAAAASECAAAEAGATSSDPEQQAVERHLLPWKDAAAAEVVAPEVLQTWGLPATVAGTWSGFLLADGARGHLV